MDKTIFFFSYLYIMVEHQPSSFFYKAHHPGIQATIVFIAGLVVTLMAKLIHYAGILEVSDRFPWMSAASFLLFFSVFNSIFSLSAPDLNKYWTKSMLSFGALVLMSGLVAWGISSMDINEAGSYRWIFMVLTFGYLVFLSILGFLKRIVEFAEKERWTSPRKKN
ncbi:MAG: hypothetical protein HKN16_05805 [Saprospiraceae bacterium]|nr:hypothetical protein [Saprospiraceae bacterium]